MGNRNLTIGLFLACALATASMAPADPDPTTDCPELATRIPAPANEVAGIIDSWLRSQHYKVRRNTPRPGCIRLLAQSHQGQLAVIVEPKSALASTVVVQSDGDIPAGTCRRLQEKVAAELISGTAPPSPPIAAQKRRQAAPAAVLEQFDAVVCIHAHSAESKIQFSGFVVDPAGLVLCTAHNLADHQDVLITFYDGTTVKGEVVRLDFDLDIALVVCKAGGGDYISLDRTRNLLGMGEFVFSIGCPNSLSGTLTSGTVSGPPRRVGDMPMWQVDMDIFPGSSGSPVFDDQGRLVAMVKGRYRGTSTVGFLTPVETIIAFLLEGLEE